MHTRLAVTLVIVSLAGAGLLVGCAGGPGTSPAPAVPTALADVCRNGLDSFKAPTGAPGAGAAVIGGRNHLVILSSRGEEIPMTNAVPAEWHPATLADTEFVACVSDNVADEFEICTYTPSGEVTRVRYSTIVTVYEAATGREVWIDGLPSLRVDGSDPPQCPQENPTSSRLEGERVDWAAVQPRLEGLVAGEVIGMVKLTLTGGPDAGSYSLPDLMCSFGIHEPDVWQLEALDDSLTEGFSDFFFVGYEGEGFTTLAYSVTNAKLATDVTIGPWQGGTTYSVLVAKTAKATLGEGAFSVDVKGDTATFTFTGEDADGVGIAWTAFCPHTTR
jgi:hypothetical protein